MLSGNLIKGGLDNVPRFKESFGAMFGNEDDLARFARKGVFPYEWLDSPEKLAHPGLPAQEDFRSELTGSGVSEANYEQARWVWDRFGCRTFGDYQDTYLKADVILLADVFESYRDTAHAATGVEPLWSVSLPGAAWDGALRKAADAGLPNIELLRSPDMYMMFERGIRGGVSQISHR